MTAEQLWQEHQNAPFPDVCRGEEVNGVDLIMLDADTVGCISTFFDSKRDGRNLDLWRTAILGMCYGELCQVASHLEGGTRDYFSRLGTLARVVLEAIRNNATPRN